MLPQATARSQLADVHFTPIGIRHRHVTLWALRCLLGTRSPAAGETQFVEPATGCAQFRARLQEIERHGNVHFFIRLDAAGQYADNTATTLPIVLQSAKSFARILCSLRTRIKVISDCNGRHVGRLIVWRSARTKTSALMHG